MTEITLTDSHKAQLTKPKTPPKVSYLSFSGKALQAHNEEALLKLLAEIEGKVGEKDPNILNSIITVANQLAQNVKHLPRAITAFRKAATYASQNNIQKNALKSILKHAVNLPSSEDIIDALSLVIAYTPSARYLGDEAAQGIVWRADDLPTASQSVEAFFQAANHATKDSDIILDAVEGVLRHAEALESPAKIVEAILQAAEHTPFDSFLRQQTAHLLFDHAGTLETEKERVDAFKQAAIYASPVSQLEKDAMKKYIQSMGRLPSIKQRTETFIRDLALTDEDSQLHKGIEKELSKLGNVSLLLTKPEKTKSPPQKRGKLIFFPQPS